jgi:hypothetical protein
MLATELNAEVRANVQRLKEVQDAFQRTYSKLCAYFGGPEWPKKKVEMVLHRVREEIVPIMEQAGMDPKEVQALCAWAEKNEMRR